MNDIIKAQLFGSLGVESAEAMAEAELSNVTEDDLPEENIEEESSVAEALEDSVTEEEVDDIEDQGEDLEDASESLDELDVAVEGFVKQGISLSKIEAVALKATVAQITRKFVKNTDSVVPAVENFIGDNTDNTVLAHEGIKETATAFKDGAIAAAKKAYETLKQIIMDVINRFKGIESRANKIIVAAKAISGELSGEISINKDGISVNGDTSFDTIKGGFDRFIESVSKMKDAKTITQYAEIMKEVNEPGEGKVTMEKIFEGQNKFMDASFDATFGENTESDGKKTSKPFPGEFVAVLNKPKSSLPLFYESFERLSAKEKGGDAKVSAVQPNEIIAIATAVKGLQQVIAEYKGFINRVVETMKRINSVHVTDSDRFEDKKDIKDKDKDVSKAIKESATLAVKKQMVFYAKLVSSSNTISSNMLTLCEKSLSAKGPTAEEKKEEPKTEETK